MIQYYQMLLNNQTNHGNAYVSPFQERDVKKDMFINKGVEVEKKRSEAWLQQERRRNQEIKKNYRELLAEQVNEKYHKNAVDKEIKIRQQQAFQNITYTPQELAKFERERKLAEMNKYKEDLDTSSPQTNSRIKVKERSMTGVVEGRNDFNLINASTNHNPILNPLPYNLQNPSILRDMQRKRQISEQHNTYAHPY